MYTNNVGCDAYPTNYVLGSSPSYIIVHGARLYMPVCYEPSKQPLLSFCVFVSYVVITSFILFNLTVAAVTTGIKDRLSQLKRQMAAEDHEQKNMNSYNNNVIRRISRTGIYNPPVTHTAEYMSPETHAFIVDSRRRTMDAIAAAAAANVLQAGHNNSHNNSPHHNTDQPITAAIATKVPPENLPASNNQAAYPNNTSTIGQLNFSTREDEKALLRSLLMRVWRNNKDAILKSEDKADKKTMHKYLLQFSFLAKRITTHRWYGRLLTISLLASASIEIHVVDNQYQETLTEGILNYIMQSYFTLDLGLQALSLYPNLNLYFADGWNQFDIILISLLWAATVDMRSTVACTYNHIVCNIRFIIDYYFYIYYDFHTISFSYYFIALFRVIRIVRILRMLTSINELRVLLQSISSSVLALAYVVLLMSMFFYFYAVIGVYLFSRNDKYHFKYLINSLCTLFQVR